MITPPFEAVVTPVASGRAVAVTSTPQVWAVGAVQHPLAVVPSVGAVFPIECSLAAVAPIWTVLSIQCTFAAVPSVRAIVASKVVVAPVGAFGATLSVQSATPAAISPVMPLWAQVSIHTPATFPPVIVPVIVALSCLVAGIHVSSSASLPLQAMVPPTAVNTAAIRVIVVIIIVIVVEDSVIG